MRPEDRQGHNPPRCSSQPLRSRRPAYITVYWSIAKVALQNIQPTHVTMYWSIANTKVAQNPIKGISSNSSRNRKFINFPIIIYMKMAPPTLFPNLAEVFPTLFMYALIINFLDLRFLSGGAFVIPINPPKKNEAT